MNEKEIVDLLRELLTFKQEIKEKGNSDYDRISNKDILLHLLMKLDSIEKRIAKTETKQQMLMWFIPILLAIVGISRVV